MSHKRWKLLPAAPGEYLEKTSDYPWLLAQLLYNRGIQLNQIGLFLAPDKSLSDDPYLVPDMCTAVTRVYQALLSGETIAIYGDYDVDGVAATALLVEGFTKLGAKAIPYIPHRINEGYGLNITALESLRQQGASLVITVDCGITAIKEAQKAKRLGLDLIITDHHTPLDEIPPALAVVNPKRSGYPYMPLSGTGVAFKLLQAVFRGVRREMPPELLELVALGTIGDLAPLVGENRYLVKEGLKQINTSSRPGMKELITQAGIEMGSIDTECISWVLAPRLNAAGRMEHAMSAYQLLMTGSAQEAQTLAAWLAQKNSERQKLTVRFVEKAREQVTAKEMTPVLIASDADYPSGIAGLVAGRLAEEFYRPAIVIRVGEQSSSGSCRSIPEFNIMEALGTCSHLMTRFGGHSQAAGFVVPTKDLPRLQQSLFECGAQVLAGVDLRPYLVIDAELPLADAGGKTFQTIQRLSPFGSGNPVPTFLSRKVEALECQAMAGGEHLKMKLRQGGVVWNAVGFGLGRYLTEVSSPLDIVYNIEVDRWNGQEWLRLNILDFSK